MTGRFILPLDGAEAGDAVMYACDCLVDAGFDVIGASPVSVITVPTLGDAGGGEIVTMRLAGGRLVAVVLWSDTPPFVADVARLDAIIAEIHGLGDLVQQARNLVGGATP